VDSVGGQVRPRMVNIKLIAWTVMETDGCTMSKLSGNNMDTDG